MKKKILTILMLSGIFGNYGQLPATMTNKNEAERIWELAVEAKGGRTRLEAISNIVVSSMSTYHVGFGRIQNRVEHFFVFPDKEWEWNDNRPSVFGLRMTMRNWEIGKQYIVQFEGDPTEWRLEPIQPKKLDELKDKNGTAKWAGLAIYLPESKWWKPMLESTRVGVIGSQKVDVVRTVIFGKSVDFFFDQLTHLPVRISFYNPLSTIAGVDINTVELSDYVDVEGIKLPTTLKENDGRIYKMHYEVNVRFDKTIFETPPLPIESAAEAWKPRK